MKIVDLDFSEVFSHNIALPNINTYKNTARGVTYNVGLDNPP